MALAREAGRVKIRSRVGPGSGDTQWSRVRIKPLDTMDTGFYRCQATNGKQTVSAESMVKVRRVLLFPEFCVHSVWSVTNDFWVLLVHLLSKLFWSNFWRKWRSKQSIFREILALKVAFLL